MQKNLLHIQYHRLSSNYGKLKSRFEKALRANRFKDYTLHKQRQLIAKLEKMKARLLSLEQVLKLSGSALALGLMLNSGEAQAQAPLAQGSEFKVNTYTTDAQQFPAIAMDSDGNFVVTWGSWNQDDSYTGIFAQRYNALGVAQGSEFQVNTRTLWEQQYPAIAMDSDGDFVVTWQSSNQDGESWGIYAQRYNASGVAQGVEFLVNTYIENAQMNPAIAMDSDGDFVIAYESFTWDPIARVGEGNIFAQRYNASGVAQGDEFQVNTFTTNNQEYPAIAMDSDGNFVITWASGGQDGSFEGVYARRYNASGVAQGGEFRVNTYTAGNQNYPSIAMDSDGDFVIAWQSNLQDGSDYGVYAQRYNASGVAQGGEFQVNTYTTSFQSDPSIAMDSDGDFVITWTGQDWWGAGIFAQRYNALGAAVGSEFPVNTYKENNQLASSIAMDSDGDFVITWQSNLQDGEGFGIFAQRYTANAATGISKASVANSMVSVYPNPSSGLFTINSEGLALKSYHVRIVNITGETVYSGQFAEQLNLQQLNKGIYTMVLESDKEVIAKQLVIQ
jgi:phosphoheptose isomerase